MARKLIDPDAVAPQVRDSAKNFFVNTTAPLPQGRPVAPAPGIQPLPDRAVQTPAFLPPVAAPAAVAAPAPFVRPSAVDDPVLLDRNRPLSGRL